MIGLASNSLRTDERRMVAVFMQKDFESPWMHSDYEAETSEVDVIRVKVE